MCVFPAVWKKSNASGLASVEPGKAKERIDVANYPIYTKKVSPKKRFAKKKVLPKKKEKVFDKKKQLKMRKMVSKKGSMKNSDNNKQWWKSDSCIEYEASLHGILKRLQDIQNVETFFKHLTTYKHIWK